MNKLILTVVFAFLTINVFSQTNEGFVTFSITPKSNIEYGDEITNQAKIYFDFNQPIITNEVKSQKFLENNTQDSQIKLV